MATHYLKTHKEYFYAILDGRKKFEVRRNDRDFKVGDILILQNYDSILEQYMPDQIEREIYYILHGPAFGIQEGYCVMSLSND